MHETELNGIYAEVAHDEGESWWWMVKPTGRRSEYPEVFNCGFRPSMELAMRDAEEALRRADESYGMMGADGW